MIDRLFMAVRGLFVRAVVRGIDDTGGEQMLTVEPHFGRTRSQVPVHQPFGFASHAPLDGAVAPVVAVGGDHADLMALPPANPSKARFGKLGEGDSVLYDACGQRIYIQNGKIVRIDCTSEMLVTIGGSPILDLTAKQATLNVPLSVKGSITATDDITTQGDVKAASVSLTNHTHTVTDAPGTTGKPQ
ncbi:phage baseplate assembly protein [Gluconacetobacter entanii]|uniref:phage baseplate assembly protein domain-containing protein n=1 Tax=Gluconacetobacter entanii TaxID=108528 RepID=UPI001C93476C|nr:phage baseplate assembly protein [Gluconacetobacter entanii]MBY4640281.1 phage baseplate assembly protein [Gluconacetobacter entanii]MCW4579945.1 phage baseplate assembly protein [Gluconacetobacter entanii]MCW4584658.1 phage baseplate assembly protein [Gluconacetobacter entanii]MCW4588080.1 phage baseplate assembly protein [Gluconacetobacter entanii]